MKAALFLSSLFMIHLSQCGRTRRQSEEGEECKTPNGRTGICRDFFSCSEVMEMVNQSLSTPLSNSRQSSLVAFLRASRCDPNTLGSKIICCPNTISDGNTLPDKKSNHDHQELFNSHEATTYPANRETESDNIIFPKSDESFHDGNIPSARKTITSHANASTNIHGSIPNRKHPGDKGTSSSQQDIVHPTLGESESDNIIFPKSDENFQNGNIPSARKTITSHANASTSIDGSIPNRKRHGDKGTSSPQQNIVHPTPGEPKSGNFVFPRRNKDILPSRKTPRTSTNINGSIPIKKNAGNNGIMFTTLKNTTQPTTGQAKDGIPRSNKTDSNSSSFSECGKTYITGKITGGKASALGAWPWMSALGYRSITNSSLQWLCGGALITDRHVITAAHCVVRPNNDWTLLVVRLGDLDLLDSIDDGARPIDMEVESVVQHSGYKPGIKINDIAVIKMKSRVNFNCYIQPICLPVADRLGSLVGKAPYVAGWGSKSFGEPSTNFLQQVNVSVVDENSCRNAYYNETVMLRIDERVICAGNNGKDACQGDSGSPLMYEQGDVYYLVGVVSHGVFCGAANFPGVYTRVSSFLDWINSTTSTEVYL